MFFYKTPIGRIGIAENGDAITHLFWGNTVVPKEFEEKETPLLKSAFLQLHAYFNGTRKAFDLPLAPQGTAFQLSVWDALLTIPYGETRSYQQIARQIQKPKACRAVGMANHANPISIFIPCHRVIGADGSLTGYGGGLDVKKRLLDWEAQNR